MLRACCVVSLVVVAAAADAGVLLVDGKANIFGAGHAAPPDVGFGSDRSGILPPFYGFVSGPGLVLTFSDVTGAVDFDVDGLNTPVGPDGGQLYTKTDVESYGGIAGIIHNSGTMFLVGLFLGDSEPVDPAPVRLDFSTGALGTNFASLSPLLNQTFFIGDGRTGTGAGDVQEFYVPIGATRLYLGFADSYSTATNTMSGLPGAFGSYMDNEGSLAATFDISGSSTVPEPGTLALLSLGSAGMGFAGWRKKRWAAPAA